MKSAVSPDQYDESALNESNRQLLMWESWSAFRGKN